MRMRGCRRQSVYYCASPLRSSSPEKKIQRFDRRRYDADQYMANVLQNNEMWPMIQVLGKSKEIDGMTTEAIRYLRSIYHQFHRHRRLFVLFLFRSRKPRHEGTICSPHVISLFLPPPLFLCGDINQLEKYVSASTPHHASRTFSFTVSAEYGWCEKWNLSYIHIVHSRKITPATVTTYKSLYIRT